MAGRRDNLAQDIFGDRKILFELERRERIEVALAGDFIGQSIGDGRGHAEEIVQRVGVLGFGEAPDDERARILVAEVLQLRQPLREHAAIVVGWLRRAFRRHVVRHHPGVGLLPLFGERGVFGSLEGGREVHAGSCRALTAVAGKAVSFDERRDAVTKVLRGVGFEGVVIPRLRGERAGQGQHQPEAPCRRLQKTTDRGGNGHERRHVHAKFITPPGCAQVTDSL